MFNRIVSFHEAHVDTMARLAEATKFDPINWINHLCLKRKEVNMAKGNKGGKGKGGKGGMKGC